MQHFNTILVEFQLLESARLESEELRTRLESDLTRVRAEADQKVKDLEKRLEAALGKH